MKLHADSIEKSYGTHRVLSDVFISCQVGEVVGLLGRNGCGKSTLLQIIFGSLRADYKYVTFDDELIRTTADGKNKIAYLPQHNFLPGVLRVRKLIQLFCTTKNAQVLLVHPYLEQLLDLRSSELSGGQARLVEVLLIIHSRAKIVLLDEPFNAIAPLYREEVQRLIRSQLHQKGFIVSDHDYHTIIDLSDRIVYIHQGSTRRIDQPTELEEYGYVPHGMFS